MDWHQPVSIDFGGSAPSPTRRALLFFGHYDCRVYLTKSAYIDVGAGSLACARSVTEIPEHYVGSLGSIGRFCEFATCEIQVAGEHENKRPINIGFSQSPLLAQVIRQGSAGGLASPSPVDIGNNVVISSKAIVLGNVQIADGAVVGAGAVVTRPVKPFEIVAGVPARKIADRFDENTRSKVQGVRWWDFCPSYIAANSTDIQQRAQTPGLHKYRQARPRFAFALSGQDLKLAGIVMGDGAPSMDGAPPQVLAYIQQALGDGPYYWLADCWEQR
jgi:hypothetical protein